MAKKRSTIRKNIPIIISLIALFFLGVGTVLGLWSASKMSEQVMDQANEEQLVLSRNTAGLIERELRFIKKEIRLLS